MRGATLLRDGNEWIPKGVNVTALTFPAESSYQQGCATCREVTAEFGSTELDAIAAMGADTVRLPITEMYLDPQNPSYDQSYIRQIGAAVDAMRRRGLVVILAMFRPYADPAAAYIPAYPSETTLRAWQQIAPIYRCDGGVIFDLYNEPSNANPQEEPTLPGAWGPWVTEHQPIVDMIGRLQGRNALIVEALLDSDYVSGLSVDEGGAGYKVGDQLTLGVPSTEFSSPATVIVLATGAEGQCIGLLKTSGGVYFGNKGSPLRLLNGHGHGCVAKVTWQESRLPTGKLAGVDAAGLISRSNPIIYSNHPYSAIVAQSNWYSFFGFLHGRAPYIAGEWIDAPFSCMSDTEIYVKGFLDRLREWHFGVIAWAFDAKPATLTEADGKRLSSYKSFECKGGGGAGLTLQTYWRTGYAVIK